MEKGHGADAVPGVLEDFDQLWIPGADCLKVEKAGYDLEIVLDAVMDLLKQGDLVFK